MSVPIRSSIIRNTLLAAAAAGLAIAVPMSTAEAKHKSHHHFGIVLNLGGPHGYISSGYGPPCRWLKKKAIHTGSPYWWNRYYNCILY